MLFDLYDLLPPPIDLSVLEADFSKEEIDGTISEPQLINSLAQIAQDFLDICDSFQQGILCTRSINTSYITLIPKIEGASKVIDFRTISLLNTSMRSSLNS
jgi:hypothetical protein